MKSCQASFCTPLKICQKWPRFIKKVKLCKFIENTLKIDYHGRNFNIVGKGYNFCLWRCRKNFNDTVRFLVEGSTKFKVQKVVNLFEDTGSVRELNYLVLKYPDRFLVLNGRTKASNIINYVQMLSLTL
jgi:hypothetical protein